MAGRPAGRPIGPVVQVPPGPASDTVREALAAVDAVHGDGYLPPLPVRPTRGRREIGRYEYDRRGRPLRLTVNPGSDRPHLTVVHELGHVLDHQALGRPGRFASETGNIPDVMRAIAQSEAVRMLKSRQGRRQARVTRPDGSRFVVALERRVVAYLLEPKELFARAYAQYIAVRSGHPELRAQLDRERRAMLPGMVYHTQWTDADFEAISQAIDRELRRNRWVV